MKIKKIMGYCMLIVTAMVVNAGTASIAMVGIEEMPESMKNLR